MSDVCHGQLYKQRMARTFNMKITVRYLRQVNWCLNAFTLIKSNIKGNLHLTGKDRILSTKYCQEELWSQQRWTVEYGEKLSIQMPSRDITFEECYFFPLFPCNRKLFVIIVTLIFGTFLLYLKYVRLEFSRIIYIGGLCRPRLFFFVKIFLFCYL